MNGGRGPALTVWALAAAAVAVGAVAGCAPGPRDVPPDEEAPSAEAPETAQDTEAAEGAESGPTEGAETGAAQAEAPAVEPGSCEPVEGPLTSSSQAAALAGTYRLELVATSGEAAGAETSGTMTLEPNPDELTVMRDVARGSQPIPGVLAPLYGTAEVEVAEVGGTIAGELSSADPERPGVLVLESRPEGEETVPQIVIRLGSDANDRAVQRFDGAFFALTVTAVTDEAFFGRWASGVMGRQARGHFCAWAPSG